MSFVRASIFGLIVSLSFPLAAQEPTPVSLQASSIESGGVGLTYPWRFAPGDDATRRDPAYDDSGWSVISPREITAGDGVFWFRRHLRLAPDLVGVPVVIRIEAAGTTEVFLNGRRLLASAAVEGGTAGAWTTTHFTSASSVLAVRRECSGCAPAFYLRIESLRGAAHRRAQSSLDAVLTTVPLVLALLHLGLWASDRRARENLFLALSLISFAAIVGFSAGVDLAESVPAFAPLARFIVPAIIAACFFILATFYEIRRQPWPRTWVAFALVGVIGAIATGVITASNFRNAVWSLYFGATVVEMIRLEMRSRTRTDTPVRPLVIGMIIAAVTILLQVLVVSGVLPSSFPWGRIYYVGLMAFAVGSSLFTVKSFGATRRSLERNEGEIASARKLQQAMLPRELPAHAGLDLASWLETATDVGGDYYDFREAPDGTLLLAVGDAVGHGLAAGAMVTAMKAIFGTVRGDEPLPEILEQCDRVLRRMDVRLLHMCLVLVRLRDETLEVCSAAMPPPLIRRATGAVEEVGTSGLPLGAALKGTWPTATARFEPGETLLIASDGLGELLDPTGTPIGFDAVAETFGRVADGTAREVLAALRAAADRWRNGAPQADDITIVVARRTG